MSGRHHEPRVVNADKSPRVPYLKPKSRIGISWNRLLYNVRYVSRHWKDRILVKTAAAVFIYTIGFVSYFTKEKNFNFNLIRYNVSFVPYVSSNYSKQFIFSFFFFLFSIQKLVLGYMLIFGSAMAMNIH